MPNNLEFKPGMALLLNFPDSIKIYGYKRIIYSKTTLLVPENKFGFIIDAIPASFYWNNAFLPVFHFKNKDAELLTSDFSLIFQLVPDLKPEADLIIDFVLYNTNLGEDTFYPNVRRYFGVSEILIDNGLRIIKKPNDQSKANVYEAFLQNIDNLVNSLGDYRHSIFLSGGGESRINAAIAAFYKLNADFFTWGHPEDKEYIIASEIAGRLKRKHYNIRYNTNEIPYKEYLNKTGYMSVMQYATRYLHIKLVKEISPDSVLWTGWGDINGFPAMIRPTEMFTNYYLSLYSNDGEQYPLGWNKEWLIESGQVNDRLSEQIRKNPNRDTFMGNYHDVLAPRIFGQVISAENTILPIICPWFDSSHYNAVKWEESLKPDLKHSKLKRTLWKGNLYYQIIKKYHSELNRIIHAKGFYPYLLNKKYGYAGIATAILQKKYLNKGSYPTDAIEDRNWMASELDKIRDTSTLYFDKKAISEIISRKNEWKSYEIFEYFKLIQINWLLNER